MKHRYYLGYSASRKSAAQAHLQAQRALPLQWKRVLLIVAIIAFFAAIGGPL